MTKRTPAQIAAQFKKGNPGGPGPNPMRPEIREIRQLQREDLVQLAMMVFKGDVVALAEIMQRAQHEDPAQRPTAIQLLMASCMMNAIKKGDVTVLNSLLDRFFGRTPIAIQVQHTDQAAAGSTAKTIVFETVNAATG